MKKLLIILPLLSLILSCCMTEDEVRELKEKTYFLDEDFVLIDAHEKYTNSDGETLRTWVIQRMWIENGQDSIYRGEISTPLSISADNSSGTYCGDFIITNDLWNNRKVGDILHFDYIRKDRFYKVHMVQYTTEKVPIVFNNEEEFTKERLEKAKERYQQGKINENIKNSEKHLEELEKYLEEKY